MTNSDLPFVVAFSHSLGIGPMGFQKLLRSFDSIESAYKAPLSSLAQILGTKLAEKHITYRNTTDPTKLTTTILRKGIHIVEFGSPQYPESLSQIKDPPICLYVKGDYGLMSNSQNILAVVGTRRPTPYGKEVTYSMTSALAQAGMTIISGMALGIDTIAHKAALDSNCHTIAVLGCGVNIIYPPGNDILYHRILKEGSCIVSEFPPDMYVLKGLFVARNRIISALSQGVLVVEGSATSGTLITARYAAEQGKDVFAIPAPITSDQSKAPNILIKEGAIVVTAAQDILDVMHLSYTDKTATMQRLTHNDPLYNSLLEILSSAAYAPDVLANHMELSIDELLPILSELELDGTIGKDSEGKYFITYTV